MSEPRKEYSARYSGYGYSATEKIRPGIGKAFPMQFALERAEMTTVQFGLQLPPGSVGGTIKYQAEGEITWSVAGNRTRRLVTIADGMCISGPAEHVNVQITDASEALTEAGFTLASDYIANVTVAPGSRPSMQQPPYYEDPDGPYSVVAGASQVVQIPVNIGVVSVYVTVATTVAAAPIAQNAVLVQHASSIAANIWKSYDPRDYEWVPLSPGASELRLLTLAAAPTPLLFTVIYGIDG